MKTLAVSILATLLVACSSNTTQNSGIKNLLNQGQSPIVFSKEPTPVLVSVKSLQDIKLSQKVNILIKGPMNIIAAIDFADESLSVSVDAGVDLDKKFNVKFNNQTLDKYLTYLENKTGYDIKLIDSVVYVRSIVHKNFNLQTLSLDTSQIISSAQSEVSSNGQAPTEVSSNGQAPTEVSSNGQAPIIQQSTEWDKIVDQVGVIMNTHNDTNSNNTQDGNNDQSPSSLRNNNASKVPDSVITDNQKLGVITVMGLPSKVKQVEFYLDNLISKSNRQIHLQVQVLDITVDESVGQGINWNLISDQSSQFQVGNNATQIIDGAGIISIGTPVGGLIDLGKKITLDIMLELLAKQGKVRVDNQPNITVTNGDEAYISTGDEFSYVSGIEATPDDSGNVITTSVIDRMNIGIEMRVTPKILPDNRVVVGIVPIVSSLKSFSTLTSGSGDSLQEFQTPNVALQKLATKVIVESGKTIHLGGLIASKIANATKGLPDGGILDVFFKSAQKSLERREIVILITPTIVG